jgi:hypothetical protein
MSPAANKAADSFRYRLIGCVAGLPQTTNLGVTGSNPVGRAIYHWVRSRQRLRCRQTPHRDMAHRLWCAITASAANPHQGHVRPVVVRIENFSPWGEVALT